MQIGIILALALIAAHCESRAAEPVIGEPAPQLSVTTLDGREFDLNALRGRVVLVNFWATWCAPCLAEMPALDRFYRRHHAQGLELLGASVDFPRDREKAKKIAARVHFPAALLSEAHLNGIDTPDGVPVTYVIDAKGVVRDKIIAADGELLSEAVLPLLSGTAVNSASGGK